MPKVPGGMPKDTNSGEATHKVHKQYDRHCRFDGEAYVAKLAEWINRKSANDMSFGLYLNMAVCSKRFFVSVRDMLEDDISPVTVCFRGSDGRILCASQRTLNSLKSHPMAPATVEEYAEILFKPQPGSFLGAEAPSIAQSFVNGTQDPRRICSPMDFDEWCCLGKFILLLDSYPRW